MAKVINSNKTGVTDGSMANMLNRLNVHVPIVIVSRTENFVFNDELLGLDKYVLCDASEHGWDFSWQYGTPLFGKNFEYHKSHFYNNDEYTKFNQFVSDRRPLIYFKRELLKKDANDFYVPIEYAAFYEAPIQSLEEFNSRPLEVFFNWGLSNPMRPRLQGDIWKMSNDYGYSVCDNFNSLQLFLENEGTQRKWMAVNTPHYTRIDIKNVLHINGMAKVSVCLWGAGRKCFRHSESPINSVMFMPEDDMAWNFMWTSGLNCIKYRQGEDIISALNEATKRKDLYDIYLAGVETCKRYSISSYTKYLSDIINQL